MSIHIEIKTDLRVKQFLSILLEIENIKLEYEIDSTNYGEGYHLTYKDLELRLHDTFRSDEAGCDIDFVNKEINWDQAFEKVVLKNAGDAFLEIEIDRDDDFEKNKQTELSELITDKLKKRKIYI